MEYSFLFYRYDISVYSAVYPQSFLLKAAQMPASLALACTRKLTLRVFCLLRRLFARLTPKYSCAPHIWRCLTAALPFCRYHSSRKTNACFAGACFSAAVVHYTIVLLFLQLF
jgi:hypothetical protein